MQFYYTSGMFYFVLFFSLSISIEYEIKKPDVMRSDSQTSTTIPVSQALSFQFLQELPNERRNDSCTLLLTTFFSTKIVILFHMSIQNLRERGFCNATGPQN